MSEEQLADKNRKWEQPVNDFIKVPRDKFIVGVVISTLIGLAFTGYQIGLLPLVTLERHKKDMLQVWGLKERVTVLETKLGIPAKENKPLTPTNTFANPHE